MVRAGTCIVAADQASDREKFIAANHLSSSGYKLLTFAPMTRSLFVTGPPLDKPPDYKTGGRQDHADNATHQSPSRGLGIIPSDENDCLTGQSSPSWRAKHAPVVGASAIANVAASSPATPIPAASIIAVVPGTSLNDFLTSVSRGCGAGSPALARRALSWIKARANFPWSCVAAEKGRGVCKTTRRL